jgi:hypothetical protein
MSSYEPDPKTAKLFARHKQATETLRDTKKPVAEAVEDAIRQGATSPQLAALTGMTTQTIRNIAERLGIDIRVKAPTVGREAEALRAGAAPPEPNERPSPSGWIPHLPDELGLEPEIRKLTPAQVKAMVEQVERDHAEWFQKARRPFARVLPTYLPYVLANDAWINKKVELPGS